MTSKDGTDIAGAIAPYLPYLRRFARALTGRQSTGDQYAAATLHAILEDSTVFDPALAPKVALFRVFHTIWSSSGAPVDEPESPEGALAVKAQSNLRSLTPSTRVALLLGSLEDFGAAEAAAIMKIDDPREAADLIEAGRQELDRQIAGRVLIIEDEPIIAMDLEGIVIGLGHAVSRVADTREKAVAAALEVKPDLVLADIQLADGSSGIDAVHEILDAFVVPVIFITAYPERLLTGERPEPTFLITKPFREEQVRAAISQALFFETIVDPV